MNEAKIDNLETTIENKEKEKAATIESIADTKQEGVFKTGSPTALTAGP